MRKIMIILAAAAILTSGCRLAGSGKESFGVLDTGEEITFKILASQGFLFQDNFGVYVSDAYPNVRFEYVETGTMNVDPDEYIRLIRNENPDIVWVSGSLLPRLVEEGILQPLDAYIAEDDFDIENMHAPVIDYIRNLGGGSIYALTPSFYHDVLFYNKTLFEKHGVPLPQDYMSWEEIIALAQRFPADGPESQRVYGYQYESSPEYGLRYFILHELGRTHGLEWFDPESHRLTLNTDAWKPIVELGLQLYRSGTMKIGADDVFARGRAAMMIDGYYWIYNRQFSNRLFHEESPSEWDIVTLPVDPGRPQYTHDFRLYYMYAVNAASANPDTAWDILKYINSDTFAALISPSTLFAPTRPDRIRQIDGVAMDTFYKLKPDAIAFSEQAILPQSFQEAFTAIFNEELERVMNNEKSLDQALADLEARGQAELDLALADEQD